MIIIYNDKIIKKSGVQENRIKNISPYFYINQNNGEIIYVQKLEYITNIRLLRKLKSLQELILEGNLDLLLKIINNIRHYDLNQEVLFINYIYISKELNNTLLSYNIKIEPLECENLFINLDEKKIKYIVDYYVDNILQENKSILKENNINSIERIHIYLEKIMAYYLIKLLYFENSILKFKIINDTNKIVDIELIITCINYNYVRKLIRNDFEFIDECKMYEKYKVCVISPFSYGKSTLINCLISNDLLKTDIRAETANITKLINANKKEFLVKRINGQNVVEEYFYKDFDDLSIKLKNLTREKNDENKIEEVYILGEFNINKKITIIDSPGLFSKYEYHDKLTLKNVLTANLILFVIDPQCVGESNFTKVIKQQSELLLNYKKDFCIVMTKRDLCDFYEEKKLLNELKIVLKEVGIDYVDVIFISAYQALKIREFKNKRISLENIKKDKLMFAIEDGEIIRGKNLEEKHLEGILDFSNIKLLEERIEESLTLYGSEV